MSETSFAFRLKHLLALLESFDTTRGALDYWISQYFRAHSSLGSKDRAFISEAVYGVFRWHLLIDYILQRSKGKEAISWKNRIDLYLNKDLEAYSQDTSIPAHIRVSMPEELFNLIRPSWGDERAFQIALACNQQAPTTIRANTLKISRDELLKKFQDQGYIVSPCTYSSIGIVFHKKVNFFSMPEFTLGFFEIQDEASQLAAQLVTAGPNQHVLDFCAGSGGKTLAFAPKLQGKGQLYLHDIRKEALQQAKKRLNRAGIQNVQFISDDQKERLSKLKKKMDWVFVDAPCSGSGTLRRNPDMKWKITEEIIDRLVSQQRTIFEQALSFVKPEGHIVYATCSIISKENFEQVEHFLKTYSLELKGSIFQTVPEPGQMDGFFAAVFQKK